MKHLLGVLAAAIASACMSTPADPVPPPGSNEMLRAAISGAAGLEVIISDVVIPPGATVPRHYHPGEEFVYVIAGSAIHTEQGKPDIELKAGDTYVIAPEAVHSPRGGADGARAVVFRVHVAGSPERILVDSADTGHAHDHGHDHDASEADHRH